ncbi:sulfite exporter TauE/SafE family protein [Natranaerobius trueperi]|uniref:Probable membrane transporter protein n=1 Tax=Natranaerobius trueperi TaxID=759412 RepID=A0A226C1N1_9FIRM|nr:sulfite exporter TauE/SafE family protein [Natranaerobius trueperi]OWZ84327.1 permease [Natranaerobius trueperi]
MIGPFVLGVLSIMGLWFLYHWIKAFKEDKPSMERFGHLSVVGFVTNFFDTLGIGCFAPSTAWFKGAKLVTDKKIPGTLNVGFTTTVILMFFIFFDRIEVDPLTLILMLAAAFLGAILGADIVSGLSERKVQLGMGFALLVTAVFVFLGQVDLMPVGGEALGLRGWQLALAVGINFILGALMTLGIGLYAPCMALVYALGMNPAVAFPIMMGSCAYLMPGASVKFIKNRAFDLRASLAITLAGIPAVFIAAFWVTGLPIHTLTWLVFVVITYTSIVLIRDGLKNTEEEAGTESPSEKAESV